MNGYIYVSKHNPSNDEYISAGLDRQSSKLPLANELRFQEVQLVSSERIFDSLLNLHGPHANLVKSERNSFE